MIRKPLLGLLLVALSACGGAEAAETDNTLPEPEVLAPISVGALRVDTLAEVGLSGPDSLMIHRLTDLFTTPDGIYVVDGGAKRVLKYSPRGKFQFEIGQAGGEDDQYDDPYRVSARHDSIFILDLGQPSRVLAFDRAGHFSGTLHWKNERMPTDLRLTATGMAVSTTVPTDGSLGRHVLHVVSASGRVVTGCDIDGRVFASDKRGGMMGALSFASVSILGDRVYCAQPTTPVVQVMDTLGHRLPPVTVAPPFYQAPVDRKLSMNTKTALAYGATYTTHAFYQPTVSGFVSIYSRYDTTAQESRFTVFACDSATGKRQCGTALFPHHVVRVVAPDTIYAEEELANGAVRLRRFRVHVSNR